MQEDGLVSRAVAKAVAMKEGGASDSASGDVSGVSVNNTEVECACIEQTLPSKRAASSSWKHECPASVAWLHSMLRE